MNSKEEWLARQQRMTKCPKHGLHFDPQMSNGCVRCLKERSKVRTKRPPQLFIILLCTLGLAVVLFRIFGPSLVREEEALVGLEITEVEANRQLDANAYRSVIEPFEAVLFRSPSSTSADLEITEGRLISAADALGQTFMQQDPDAVGSREISELANSLAASDLTFVQLERMRDRWLTLRQRYFDAADWFEDAGGSTDVAAEQRASRAENRDIAFELASLLRQASSEVEGLSSTADRTPQWREFAATWNDELQELASRKAKRPSSNSDGKILLAFQNLERAFNMARSVGASSRAPADATGFEDALRFAEEAIQHFDEAE